VTTATAKVAAETGAVLGGQAVQHERQRQHPDDRLELGLGEGDGDRARHGEGKRSQEQAGGRVEPEEPVPLSGREFR
jgi:hypothetical protein